MKATIAVLASLAFLCPTVSWAQGIPTVTQWIAIFQEVHKHPLFKDLKFSYARIPAEKVGHSPVGVIPRDGQDCVIAISEGDNSKMGRMMALTSSPETARAFLMTIAAHEFGHCFRIRSKNLSLQLWERVLATAPGSADRQAMEKVISVEEAYADAYAFAYIRDAHPQMFMEMFKAMRSLRHEPSFANPFYQVEPLYLQLASRGLDVSLPLQMQVEDVMRASSFQVP
ncbi:MAG: hypothetical protein LH632_21990 [Rhodoferax sp.]|nr:hypothetical protein [Rhodoferax sp.]